MKYNEIFKNRRLAKGLTQQEVADKCKVSLMTVSASEQPYKKSRPIPSESYMKTFAKVFGGNRNDINDLEKQLLVQRALLTIPESVQKYFRDSIENKSSGLCVEGEMPSAFRELVKNDLAIAKKKKQDISENDMAIIRDTINNKMFLPRNDVIKLARLLKGDVNMYLLAAEYLTDNLRILLHRHNFGASFAETLNRMPQKDLDLFMNIFTYAVHCYMKAYPKKAIDITGK